MSCIVVDLGGTHLRCGIVLRNDELVLHERIRLQDSPDVGGASIWSTIVEAIAAFVAKHSLAIARETPIVFAFPGPVHENQPVGQAPTVAGDGQVPDIAGALRIRTGRTVFMLNDVSAAAWYFQERIVADRFAVVTISSGIGSKLFDRARGVLDDVPYAGEIGHLVVDASKDAIICDCGGRGHLGSISSGRGFERHARAAARRDERAFIASACVRRFGATTASLTNEAHLVPAILAGDSWTTTILTATVEPLAQMLKVLTVGSGLQGVVIMGGFAQAIAPIYKRALSAALGSIADSGPATVALEDFVTVAAPEEEPGLLGAARYAASRQLAET